MSISMQRIVVSSVKLALPFQPGSLPRIDPDNPVFEIALGGFLISGKVNAKAARKLAAWNGGAVLQGKLISERGNLVLTEAGFQFFDPKPVETAGSDPKSP